MIFIKLELQVEDINSFKLENSLKDILPSDKRDVVYISHLD